MSLQNRNPVLCPLCGGDEHAGYLEGEILLRCCECELIILAPHRRISDAKLYYEKESHYGESSLGTEELRTIDEGTSYYMDVMRDAVNPSGKTFLDIGANSGALVAAARIAGFDAEGLEPNTALVKRAQAQGIPVAAGELSSIGTERRFDVISMMHVLEHLPDPLSTVRGIYDLLPPGGLFFVEVPNVDSYLGRKDGLSWKYMAKEHIIYFSPRTLRRLLETAGFTVLDLRSNNHHLQSLSVRQLLHYLFGKPLSRERFFDKSSRQTPLSVESKTDSLIKRALKHSVIRLIRFSGRTDFVLAVAQKPTP